MAVIKHIKSRNANYASAIEYLLFQHNEQTGAPVLDDMGRKILRDDFFMDGINCDAMSFDKECQKTNLLFHKNNKSSEIKSHHYIISFDPADCTECNLTGIKAQELCVEFAKKNFPGYQALVVTHTDGHNHSGNIHTHIVINSVRKHAVERQHYMDKPHEHEAGFKHRSTTRFLKHLQKEVMDMCEREGFHQIDLLSPAAKKITQEEYIAQRRGQKNLNEINQKIVSDGFEPTTTVFQTQKQFLRKAIEECAPSSATFEQFQSLLLEKFNISVIEKRGRYSYLHPDRENRITEKSLGTDYGKAHLEHIFKQTNKAISKENAVMDNYHENPITIFYIKSDLRLVIDLQTSVKSMQSQAYARKVKISNLQQMANTLIFIQEHGYDTRNDLHNTFSYIGKKLSSAELELEQLSSELKVLNSKIHYTGQYYSNKKIYAEFLKSKNKKMFRQQHDAEINAYEEARGWLKSHYADEQIPSLKDLKMQKEKLLQKKDTTKSQIRYYRDFYKELDIVERNVSSILNMEYESTPDRTNTKQNTQHKQKEETL